MVQQRLYEAEAEVEAKNWEKRKSDIALYEINQEFESNNYSCNRRINGQIRLDETTSTSMENWD